MQEGTPRAIPAYQLFLKQQAKIIAEAQSRLRLGTGYETPGSKLLRYILQFIDLDYLISQSNNYERYTYHLKVIRKDIEQTFERIERGRFYTNFFFNNKETQEYIIPTTDVNAIVNLPLHSNSWNDWKKVRPLRLWQHDSTEFSYNVLNDRITFVKDIPTYAIFLIDVIALEFKYYIWYTTQRNYEIDREAAEYFPRHYFIHKYIITELVWDLADIWLLHKTNELFTYNNRTSVLLNYESSTLTTSGMYGRVVKNSQNAFANLWEVTSRLTTTMDPNSYFLSRTLFSGSIKDRVEAACTTLAIPDSRMFDWHRFIKDETLLNIIIPIWQRRFTKSNSKLGLRALYRVLRRYKSRQVWQMCFHPPLKQEIKTEVLTMYNDLSLICDGVT